MKSKGLIPLTCGMIFLAACNKKHEHNKGSDAAFGLRGEATLPKEWRETLDPSTLPPLETARLETFLVTGKAPGRLTSAYSVSDVPHQILFSDANDKTKNVPFIFDSESKAWIPIHTDPVLPAYTTTTMVLQDSGLMYWGGADSNGCGLANGRYFDFESNSWAELPPADLSSRTNPRAEFYKGEVLIFGGAARQSGKCSDLAPPKDFVKTDGQFYDPRGKKWGHRVQVPGGYVPSVLNAVGTSMAGDYLLVWMVGWNSARIVALNLTTNEWLSLADIQSPEHPSNLQLSKTKDGFAITQIKPRKSKEEKIAGLSVSFFNAGDITHPKVLRTTLPGEFDHIHPERNVELGASTGFLASVNGIADSEIVSRRALILDDAENPILPLPTFGQSAPWWVTSESGPIGLSKGGNGKIIGVYFDLATKKFYRLPEIDADLDSLMLSRPYKGETLLLFEGNESKGVSVRLR